MWQSLRGLAQEFMTTAFPDNDHAHQALRNEAAAAASSGGMKSELAGFAEEVGPFIERQNTLYKSAWTHAVKEAGGDAEKAGERVLGAYLDMYGKREGEFIRNPLSLSDWFESAVGAPAQGIAVRAATGILALINKHIDTGMKDAARSTNLRFNDVNELKIFANQAREGSPLRAQALEDWKAQVTRLAKIDHKAAEWCVDFMRSSMLTRSDKSAEDAVEAAALAIKNPKTTSARAIGSPRAA